jgi:hypothetical protein
MPRHVGRRQNGGILRLPTSRRGHQEPVRHSLTRAPDDSMRTRTPDAVPTPGPASLEIEAAELDAVRRFLTSYRDEQRRDRAAEALAGPPLRLGIARARRRSAPKSEA